MSRRASIVQCTHYRDMVGGISLCHGYAVPWNCEWMRTSVLCSSDWSPHGDYAWEVRSKCLSWISCYCSCSCFVLRVSFEAYYCALVNLRLRLIQRYLLEDRSAILLSVPLEYFRAPDGFVQTRRGALAASAMFPLEQAPALASKLTKRLLFEGADDQ